MKIALILLICGTSLLAMEEIGSLSIGIHNAIGNNASHKEINSRGPAFGILIPVQLPTIPTHVKIKIAFHDIDDTNDNLPDASYLHVTNEFLFGYKSWQQNNISLLPQIGIGVSGERYKIEKGVGGSHFDIFVDLSLRLDFELPHFQLGAMFNFERDFNMGYGSFISPSRLNFSLLFSK